MTKNASSLKMHNTWVRRVINTYCTESEMIDMKSKNHQFVCIKTLMKLCGHVIGVGLL
jgi:hypothetical protein